MSIFQLFYISTAVPGFDPKEIQNILRSAHSFNPTYDLTGMMMLRGGIFLQLLEGAEENVRMLYSKIKADKRHRNLMVLMERETDHRLFSDWSMAYHEITSIDLRLINDVLSWKSLVSGKDVDDHKILHFLTLFRNKKFGHPKSS